MAGREAADADLINAEPPNEENTGAMPQHPIRLW